MGASGTLPAHAPGVTFLIPALSGELIWNFASGAISDRIGRRPVLMGITVLALLTTWPVMHWLTVAPDFTRMTLVLLWFSFFFGMYNGAMVAALGAHLVGSGVAPSRLDLPADSALPLTTVSV